MIRACWIRAIAYGIAVTALLALVLQLSGHAAVLPGGDVALPVAVLWTMLGAAATAGFIAGALLWYHSGWRHGWEEADRVHELLRRARREGG